ncbi:MAG: aldo/keto reductase [Lachnospiraceae bacterium]|nr:aldo/keto reductase [Lachnospiraceae bacterium]
MEDKTVTLNNGIEMPIIGIGTYTLTPEQAENSVYNALKDGYRLIDTANAYMNERGVGRGINRAIEEGIVSREEIFLTTKLWVSEYDTVSESLDETLARLDQDYVDLVLLHQPYGNYTKAYLDLEKAVVDGRVRAIGLSNFNSRRFDKVMKVATIPPAVLQNETHPYYHDLRMKAHIGEYGTVFEAWFSLGGRTETQSELFHDETILAIADKYGKTAPQIILRWHLQTGSIAIPGSKNPDHIAENYDIFDFELTSEEMEQLNGLNRGDRAFKMPDILQRIMFTSNRPDFNAQQ